MTNKNTPDIWESVEIADLFKMKDEQKDTTLPNAAVGAQPFKMPNLYLVDFTACEDANSLVRVLSYLELMVDYDTAPEWMRPYLKKAED